MTFEEFIGDRIETMSSNEYADVHYAWEAGIQEGIDRMYKLYDICPECRCTEGQHKMDCGRGR
jgi:hypothetical protein